MAACRKTFERRQSPAVYLYWLRRFGRWHVLAFEGFSAACPARIFFCLCGLVARHSFPIVHLLGRAAAHFSVTGFLWGMNFSDEDYQLIDLALREDIGSGDVTSQYFVGENDQASARIIAKERAIVAGADVAAEVFRRVDPALRIEILQQDGAIVAGGAAIIEIRGRARSILT